MRKQTEPTVPDDCVSTMVRTDLEPVFVSAPIAKDCYLIAHARIPPNLAVGTSGRIIVQASRPIQQLRYWMSSSGTMDKWHHGIRSYHFDLLFPAREGDIIKVFVEGDVAHEFEWVDRSA